MLVVCVDWFSVVATQIIVQNPVQLIPSVRTACVMLAVVGVLWIPETAQDGECAQKVPLTALPQVLSDLPVTYFSKKFFLQLLPLP